MRVFSDTLQELRLYIESKKEICKVLDISRAGAGNWPPGGLRNIVISSDTGVELGSPGEESFSFILWVSEPDIVRDGAVSVIGPDLPESAGKNLPFGKVVIAAVKGLDEKNNYDLYRELNLLKYDIDLKGYMVKGLPHNCREWVRISREALARGFTLGIVGGSLFEIFHKKDFIDAVEVIFITSSGEDVRDLRNLSERAVEVVNAMRKMAVEESYDCFGCKYNSICNEMNELKNIRKSQINKGGVV